MPKRQLAIISILVFLFSSPALAATIVLKTGEKIEGDVVEKSDKYVKVSCKGLVIPYHDFEIETIDGKSLAAIKNTYADETLQLLIKSEIPQGKPNLATIVTPEEYLERGVAFYGHGELDYAISNLDNAIKAKPAYPEAYLYRGLVYMDKGDPDKAIADYNKSIELNPKGEEAYFVRGRAYAAKGDQEKALADYDKAISINPNYVQAYLNRGFINIMKGNLEQTISDANKVTAINPNVPVAYYIRALAYAGENNMDQAIIEYTRAIKLNPNYIEAYANRGLAHAYNILKKAHRDPHAPSAYISMGISLLDKEGYDKAIADCTKAIELSPKYMDAYMIRARIYIMANDFDKAWADVHKVEELGGKLKPEFLEELKAISGKNN